MMRQYTVDMNHRHTRKPRTLFCDAPAEDTVQHAPEDVTDFMDRVCAELEHTADRFVSEAARRLLERTEW